ncbi:hypothetical protein EPI10_023800 [Gossypium australe]|uniref:Uncharacterized protein n=1 Tax=Gossypium australe TaxID=47621 RepID=A0A5B6VWQ9_9ROSI|nr:hypothetical protein EPI10_023800 [Gossypium australe]
MLGGARVVNSQTETNWRTGGVEEKSSCEFPCKTGGATYWQEGFYPVVLVFSRIIRSGLQLPCFRLLSSTRMFTQTGLFALLSSQKPA